MALRRAQRMAPSKVVLSWLLSAAPALALPDADAAATCAAGGTCNNLASDTVLLQTAARPSWKGSSTEYVPQRGEIDGILKQMKDEMEADLADATTVFASARSLGSQAEPAPGALEHLDQGLFESLLQKERGRIAGRSRALAALNASCIPPGMRAVMVEGENFPMVVLGDNDIVSKSLAQEGFWEVRSPSEMASKAQVTLPEGATLLDIGANLGYYTLLFANRGHHVVAVEPMTRNRRALEGSLCLNPHFRDRVTVMPVALVAPGEATRTSHCIVQSTNYDINIGNGYLKCDDAASCEAGDANCEEVKTKTLDAVLAEAAPKGIDVVKMDVEGHECNVLEGGASLFESYAPRLLQVETAWGNASECVRAAGKKYSYDLVHPESDAMNTLMTKSGKT